MVSGRGRGRVSARLEDVRPPVREVAVAQDHDLRVGRVRVRTQG